MVKVGSIECNVVVNVVLSVEEKKEGDGGWEECIYRGLGMLFNA